MLNKNFNYCFLDFETTWLSHERDDIIQVGLIITNSELQILNYFSSFVNPWYEIDTLKTIVSYTTGINPEQIMGGISLEQFKHKMMELIPENVIFVWHNIWFDIKFLKKYLGNSEFLIRNSELFIDTMDRTKALVHYPASYSLDILYPIVKEQLGSDYFKSLSREVWLEDIQNHDALSDCLICVWLIHYCLKRIQGICSSFPVAKKIIQKSWFWFLEKKGIETIEEQSMSDKVPLLDFPQKVIASSVLDETIDRKKVPNGTKLYYGDQSVEQVIRLVSNVWKYIICTNSKQKLTIIKSKCKAMGLHDISFIKEQQQVDKDKLNKVFSKPDLELREWWFFLKYCSHKLQWLGLIDLNCPWDFKLYNYIREDSKTNKSNIVLATHSAAYSLLEEQGNQDYTILFLDSERWYNSYLKYTSTAWDPVNFSRVIDNYIYEYTNDKQESYLWSAQMLLSVVDMFCGLISMELYNYTNNKKPDGQGKFEIGVISWNELFPKTNSLYLKLNEIVAELKENKSLPEQDLQIIGKQYEKLKHYIESICYVTPTGSDYISYNFSIGNSYVDYSEFAQLFNWYHHYFLSNRNQTFQPITNNPPSVQKSWIDIHEITQLEDIKKNSLADKVFILNNNPIKAKKLFEYLQVGERSKQYKILVENVTWWRGKNIALAKTNNKIILVGWYDMALQCIVEKIMPHQIIIYEQQGLLHQQIITDIRYWIS